jgi:hypothetical protein
MDNSQPTPEIRPESELEGLILRELHIHAADQPYWLVTPKMFSPPIAIHDIWRVGLRLKNRGFLKSPPGDDPKGWWMNISTEGILYCEQKGL